MHISVQNSVKCDQCRNEALLLSTLSTDVDFYVRFPFKLQLVLNWTC